MRWRKLGLVFSPSGQTDWMQSHAAVPIAEALGEGLFKIYFSSRDISNRSYTGYVIIDIAQPKKIIELSTKPVLAPGRLGEFDDSGAMATWLSFSGEDKFLYYIGWNLGVTVPFRNSIGLATAIGGGRFQRYSSGPIVDRSAHEPHFCASCCVLPGEEYWRMWYLSCTEWRMYKEKPEHRYHIKYAESYDGIDWVRQGAIAIDYKDDQEVAISRPSVVSDHDRWRMWYSYRGRHSSYRIGYAESEDGKKWVRLDCDAGIGISESGWDSEMVEYPYVFDHKGQRYMLYNGNDYGRTGFGIAVLESK
jgi:predicted GH43/DUF377 family glycosyl hydrolase